MDIRLLDEKTHELYFAEVGRFWNEGNQQAIQERKQRRFPIDHDKFRNPPEPMFSKRVGFI